MQNVKLLSGWYVVLGSQPGLSLQRFDSREEAERLAKACESIGSDVHGVVLVKAGRVLKVR